MSARSDAVQATGARILNAALRLYAAYPVDQIRLEAIAAESDVLVPTIVRRYGGKAGVIVALVTRELSQLAERRTAHDDDPIDVIVDDLVEHYEQYGTAHRPRTREDSPPPSPSATPPPGESSATTADLTPMKLPPPFANSSNRSPDSPLRQLTVPTTFDTRLELLKRIPDWRRNPLNLGRCCRGR
ncbi:TetR/AcrR family transcriptional regulator [Microbacterium sp.]|uniref:TetR/AcrR family transcriptional regulator n=1 Tax=Microbacterium sp. TaxID=51671 RepID=UPI003C772176